MGNSTKTGKTPTKKRPVAEQGQPANADAEPTLEGALSDDGVDLTLIRWMLRQSPTERLRAAQDLINAIWALRSESET